MSKDLEKDRYPCPEHNRVLDRIYGLQERITKLEEIIDSLKDKNHLQDLTQATSSSAIDHLECMLKALQLDVRDLKKTVEKDFNKENDAFSIFLQDIAVNVIKIALGGGIVAYVLYALGLL